MATITKRKVLQYTIGNHQDFAEYELTVSLAAADILAISSSPIELEPTVTGRVYIPVAAFAVRPSGGLAYTNFVSNLRLGSHLVSALWEIPNAVLDVGPLVTSGYVAGTGAAALVGEPLELYIDGGDPTDGTQGCEVTVQYRVIDV